MTIKNTSSLAQAFQLKVACNLQGELASSLSQFFNKSSLSSPTPGSLETQQEEAQADVVSGASTQASSAPRNLAFEQLELPGTNGALVVGAGIVGVALAATLLEAGIKVILLEKNSLDLSQMHDYQAGAKGNFNDFRLYAINYHNYEFLKALQLLPADYHPQFYYYLKMFAKDDSASNTANLAQEATLTGSVSYFKASTANLPYLGAFAFNDDVVKQGLAELKKLYGDDFLILDNSTVLESTFHTNPISISNNDKPQAYNSYWQLKLSEELTLFTTVVLAVDGANSYFRNQAKIPVSSHDYPTKCMMITIKTPVSDAKSRAAFQATTSQLMDLNGPKAWLPFQEGDDYVYGNLVWYDRPQTIDALTALPLEQLKARVLASYPASITIKGEEEELFPVNAQTQVLQVGSFPLVRKRALRYCQNNVMLFGDAAHTVIPLAGQGLNIGIQDVRFFQELLKDKAQPGKDYSLEALFNAYHQVRYADNTLMQEFLTKLHDSYVRPNPLQKVLANSLQKSLEVPGIHKAVLAYASGDRTLLNSAAKFLINSKDFIELFTKK